RNAGRRAPGRGAHLSPQTATRSRAAPAQVLREDTPSTATDTLALYRWCDRVRRESSPFLKRLKARRSIMIKTLILTTIVAASTIVANAQIVRGPGKAEIARTVVVCRFDFDPTCQTAVVIANTSDKFGVTAIDIPGLPDFEPIILWIPPLGEDGFFI